MLLCVRVSDCPGACGQHCIKDHDMATDDNLDPSSPRPHHNGRLIRAHRSAQYSLLSPYYFVTTYTNKCFCSQSPDLVYDATATASSNNSSCKHSHRH